VIIAGAFVNCVWPSSSTFQVDKHKFWIALSEYGDEGFGSLFARFKEVPFSAVTLEYLLLLPVSAIIGYLLHHHISFKETRWFNIGLPLDNLRKLYNLPASTKVHYTDWVSYLIDMAHYLHAIVCLPKDSYALIRSNVLTDSVRLTTLDALMFVQYHFPRAFTAQYGASSFISTNKGCRVCVLRNLLRRCVRAMLCQVGSIIILH